MELRKHIPTQPEVADFHKHLDECKQCRENPFGLCPKGVILINRMNKALMQQ